MRKLTLSRYVSFTAVGRDMAMQRDVAWFPRDLTSGPWRHYQSVDNIQFSSFSNATVVVVVVVVNRRSELTLRRVALREARPAAMSFW